MPHWVGCVCRVPRFVGTHSAHGRGRGSDGARRAQPMARHGSVFFADEGKPTASILLRVQGSVSVMISSVALHCGHAMFVISCDSATSERSQRRHSEQPLRDDRNPCQEAPWRRGISIMILKT